MAEKYPARSPYEYVFSNPVILTDPDGMEPRPPKVIAVFYHGGPFGDGKIRATSEGAGRAFERTATFARQENREFVGAVISPSATQGPGVKTGKNFLKDNYVEGDQVIVYGYSYGGDNAVNLTEAAEELGINVNTLIIVDSSDGPLRGTTVDTSVPENVELTLNVYQTKSSGGSSRSGSNSDNPNSSERSSSDGSSNSPGSRGYPHSAEGNNAVINRNFTGKGITHGNIQDKAKNIIQPLINTRIRNYDSNK